MKRIKVINKVFRSMTEAKASLGFYKALWMKKGFKVLESSFEIAEVFLRENAWCKKKFGENTGGGYLIVLVLKEVSIEKKPAKGNKSKTMVRTEAKTFVVLTYRRSGIGKAMKTEHIRSVIMPHAVRRTVDISGAQYSLAA